jgi:hypothetical protein
VDRLPITYGEFYDFPRMIEFALGAEWFFLRSEFDEDKDDYTDFYKMYRLPFRSEAEIRSHPNYWIELSDADCLGRIPISEVGFDETRRQSIDAQAFRRWLSSRGATKGIGATKGVASRS